MANFSRQMTNAVQLFVESSYTSNKSSQDVDLSSGASAIGYPVGALGNPFNQFLLVVAPNADITPSTSNSSSYTVTSGLTADLPYGWNGEMDYTWSKSTFDAFYTGQDSGSLQTDAVNGVINLLVDTIAHPVDLSRYNTLPVRTSGSSTVKDVALRAAGKIGSFSWGDPRLNFSLEHRTENVPESTQVWRYPLQLAVSPTFDYLPQAQSTDSLYAEGTVPLVTSKNAIPGVRLVELQIADRIERYTANSGSAQITRFPYATPPYYQISPTPPDADASGNGGTPVHSRATYSSNNYTFGMKYKPLEDLTARATLGTAFLPPGHDQLLPNPIVNVGADTVHNDGSHGTYAVDTIRGGNPNLKPQHSKSWDLGLIYQPTEGPLRGLRVNLQYFQIAQFGFITQINVDQILLDPTLAYRITRNAAGLITRVDESLINATESKTEGYDLSLDYHLQTASSGGFDLHAGATRMDHNKQQTSIGGPTLDYAGTPGQSPRLKANGQLGWAYRNVTLGWSTTWYGSMPQYGSAADLNGPNPSIIAAQGSDHIPSQIYHDFFAAYAFGSTGAGARHATFGGSLADGLSVQLVIKNIFNRFPAFDVQNVPFYSSYLGDLRLREFRLTVKKEFDARP